MNAIHRNVSTGRNSVAATGQSFKQSIEVSYRYALSVSMFTTSGLGISRTVPLLSLPVGFLLLAWHALLYGPAPLKTVEDAL